MRRSNRERAGSRSARETGQRPGGAGPRIDTNSVATPAASRPVAFVVDIGSASVIMPPCSSPPFPRRPCTLPKYCSGRFPSPLTIAPAPRSLDLCFDAPILSKPKLKREPSRHDSPVLISEELKYGPFTENRQWPSDNLKIARPFRLASVLQARASRDSPVDS